MAGDPLLTWVLLGLGLRNLSMAPRQIPVVKSIVRSTNLSDAERLLAQAMTMSTETEIEEMVYSDMREALSARARRRRRGTLGGAERRAGQSSRDPPRPTRRLAVASRELLREVDDLHAALAPDYFRSRGARRRRMGAADGGGPRRRSSSRDAGRRRRAGRGAGGAHLRHARRSRDGAAAPQPRRDAGRLRRSTAARGSAGGSWTRRWPGGAATGAVEVVLTTWVGNDEAEAFYERLGYRELSRVLYARQIGSLGTSAGVRLLAAGRGAGGVWPGAPTGRRAAAPRSSE